MCAGLCDYVHVDVLYSRSHTHPLSDTLTNIPTFSHSHTHTHTHRLEQSMKDAKDLDGLVEAHSEYLRAIGENALMGM
jgi:hypothetical protein